MHLFIRYLSLLKGTVHLPHINCIYRSSHPEAFLEKGVLKTCSKFTGEHPCRSLISIKLLCNSIKITFPHRCPSYRCSSVTQWVTIFSKT